jgi:hypothetical protein
MDKTMKAAVVRAFGQALVKIADGRVVLDFEGRP